jgi:hypothetical protein
MKLIIDNYLDKKIRLKNQKIQLFFIPAIQNTVHSNSDKQQRTAQYFKIINKLVK